MRIAITMQALSVIASIETAKVNMPARAGALTEAKLGKPLLRCPSSLVMVWKESCVLRLRRHRKGRAKC